MNMRILKIVTTIALIVFAQSVAVHAKDKITFPQGAIACPTWTGLLEVMKAAKGRKSEKAYGAMNANNCITVSSDAEGVEDYTLDGLLRFYMNDRALWAIANSAEHH